MTSRPLVATGGRLFQHAHAHPALAGSCPATDSAPYCWQGHLPCALESQRSRFVFSLSVRARAHADHPVLCPFGISYQLSFEMLRISGVKFHQIPNENRCGASGNPPYSISPFIYHRSTLPRGEVSDCRREL